MLVYTDGLSSPQCHGSAVTFFPPQGDPTILRCSSPYESSDESEGWAVRSVFQRLLQAPPSLRACFLIDNHPIQSKLAHSIRLSRSNEPPLPVFLHLDRGFSKPAERPALIHPSSLRLDKVHAGFQGNKASDYFSKWASHALLWHRNLTPPPPLGSLTLNKRPILCVPSAARIKARLRKHQFADLHLTFSSDFYKHFSFLTAFSFQWASGNFCMSTYEPDRNLAQYLCPVCSQNHHLDAITFTSECFSMDPLRKHMFQACPPPFSM